MEYKIIADGACDLYGENADKIGVQIVPFYVAFEENVYKKEGAEIEVRHFYKEMVENPTVFPKTSMPSVQDYVDVFTPIVKAGEGVLCICITTKFSGSYNSAVNARNMLLEDYPDAKITVINSQFISAAEGLLVYEAIRMNRDNIPYEKAVSILQKMTDIGTVYFTIGSLDYIKKGGRLGKLASMVTGILNIRPSLFLKNGEVNVSGLCRTRKKSVANVFESCKKYFTSRNIDPNTYDISVASATTPDECDELRRQVEEDFKIKCVESRERFDLRVSSITGVHTGPTTIGIGIMPKYETLL